jgi:hypothetical protein
MLATAAGTLLLLLSPFLATGGITRVTKSYFFFLRPEVFAFSQWDSWHTYMVGVPTISSISRVPAALAILMVYLMLPLVYVLFFVRSARATRKPPEWDRVLLVAVFGMAGFAGIAPAPAYRRLASQLLPACIVRW